MKTCATCRFMAADRGEEGMRGGETHSSCVRIIHGNSCMGDGYPNVKAEPAVVVDGSGYAARLCVLPTFGCVLHEEKE